MPDKHIMWCGIDKPHAASLRALTAVAGQLLLELLQEFDGLFRGLHGMPPQHALEHRIRLKPGTDAVAVRPYHYTHLQKDELEK